MRARLLLLLALAAFPAPATAATLTVYTPHGRELMELCEAHFKAAHPTVKLRWLDMGSQEILDRLRAEAKRPRADVWYGAPATMFMQAATEELLDVYHPSWASAVAPGRHDRDWRWVGTFLTPQVILFNAKRVGAAEIPTRWSDLLVPPLAGRVVLREPLASGTMRTIFGGIIQSAPTETDGLRDLARLDAATAQYVANPTLLFQSLARGRGDVTVWNLPDAMLQIQEYGFPFDYRVPQDGTPVLVDAIALVDGGASNPAAIAFVELVTSAPVLSEMAHRFFRIPVREDLVPTTLPDWMATPIPPLEMDWQQMAREGPRWMNLFDRQIKGRGRDYLRDHDAP